MFYHFFCLIGVIDDKEVRGGCKIIQAIENGRQRDISLGYPPGTHRDTFEFSPFKANRHYIGIENGTG